MSYLLKKAVILEELSNHLWLLNEKNNKHALKDLNKKNTLIIIIKVFFLYLDITHKDDILFPKGNHMKNINDKNSN